MTVHDARVTKIKRNGKKTTVILEIDGELKPELDNHNCFIEVDPKRKTCKTNRLFHALLRDISNHTGNTPEEIKASIKDTCEIGFNKEYGTYSWASATRKEASEAIKHTLDIVRDNGIPLSKKSIDEMDAESHMSICMFKKVCLICGKPADTHHVKAIGMGRDRTKIDDSDMKKAPLCREHHGEIHQIGKESFMEKHHLKGYF